MYCIVLKVSMKKKRVFCGDLDVFCGFCSDVCTFFNSFCGCVAIVGVRYCCCCF